MFKVAPNYIPKLMCTQHPDSTVKITAQEEVDEAVQGFSMYRCDEVMVDYEGKLTPYAQPKDIVVRASQLGIAVGEKFYITPRIPNPRLEDLDRMSLSLEASIIANYYSYKLLNTQAVKWVILPMVESIDVVALIQRLIVRKSQILSEELGIPYEPIQLIPLVEDSAGFITIHDYVLAICNVFKRFDIDIDVLRIFLGKSDAAVRSGHIASALALMFAINELKRLEKELNKNIKIIIGMGSPPFRGGINNPKLVELEVQHYRGYSTVTIQSAIRYDVPFDEYHNVYRTLIENIDGSPRSIDSKILDLVERSTLMYRSLVKRYIEKLNSYATYIPQTRDRITWRIYGRTFMAEDKVLNTPRAIVYTATWYSLGVPPTLLDADFIIDLYKRDEIDILLKYIPYLKKEIEYDSQYYDPEIAMKRLDEEIIMKINNALDILGIKPERNDIYRSLLELNPVEPHIIALGKIRGFLG
ncbi:phosphoenolpyruvate carboxylase [Ignisphaera aggregans DSM 17230]|uniref:Phosphoenolpyruvate carboxylase n=1 Tax=Ignisphaera aggregans (strain DSM 17230 / JCM 13409 / AQ1.S1) TaxID=583356 RepID=E0SSB1_IGNAA|nr:phosphoenolpyruvate carboxylase [Ignisphaera aggregans DSM 17230]